MTVAAPAPTRSRPSAASRRFGYFVGSAVNLAMLYIADNLLEWGWFPWLTEAFEDVLPLLSLSLVVAMLCNVAWMAYDARWFKSLGNIIQSIFSFAVTIRLLQVFPFDFSAYDFNWATVTRAILLLALVGVGIALVVESVKLLTRKAT